MIMAWAELFSSTFGFIGDTLVSVLTLVENWVSYLLVPGAIGAILYYLYSKKK